MLLLFVELIAEYQQIIPEEYQDEQVLGWSWVDFLLACVFYEPPDTQLLEFAAYADPPYDPAPIRLFPDDRDGLHQAARKFWLRTIAAIARHPRPLPTNGRDLLSTVLKDNPDVLEEHRAAAKQVPRRHYIEVNEDTTAGDVQRAFSVIAAKRREKKQPAKGGAPPRDQLTCLQCAILYDRHNARNPKDIRRKEWTHEKLAKWVNESLPNDLRPLSAGAVPKYVKEGRQYLRDKP